jgi:hypothetical protein
MTNDGRPTNQQRPSAIDVLFDVPNAFDRASPDQGIDTRLRLGSERTSHGPTQTDAEFVQKVLRVLPEAQRPTFSGDVTVLPAPDDAKADIKRSLRYDGPAGFGLVTSGQLSKYLGGDEVSRILDGSFRVYAVDQPAVSEASGSAGGEGGGESGPKLSYLRLGKAEPKLGTDDGGHPVEGTGAALTRAQDPMMDAKYHSGIGAFTQGEIVLYSKEETNLIADDEFHIVAKGMSVTSYGPCKTLTFEGVAETGGQSDAKTKLTSAEWRYQAPDGWYKQGYELSRKLEFSTANTGEIKTSAGYGLSLGLSFEHKFAAGLETGYAANVEVKGETKVKVTANGFESETPFGKFEVADKVELSGNESVEIGCARLVDVGMTKTMKAFSVTVRAAVAAQNAAFLAYQAALASRASRTTVEAGKAIEDIDDYDQEGFATAFKKGPAIYEAAIALSAATCAAGIVLAAVQAALSKAPDPEATPTIKMDPFSLKISAGPTSITMTTMGIYLKGLTLGLRGLNVIATSPKTSFKVA